MLLAWVCSRVEGEGLETCCLFCSIRVVLSSGDAACEANVHVHIILLLSPSILLQIWGAVDQGLR